MIEWVTNLELIMMSHIDLVVAEGASGSRLEVY
jgi:hypothetical protein